MSNFEDRVNAAAGLEMTDRYKALAKLDPEIAKRYVIGVNPINEKNLRDGRPLEGSVGSPHMTWTPSLRPARPRRQVQDLEGG